MTVDLSAEEMEMVLLALKEQIRRLRADGGAATEETNLVARLEVVERESRASRPANPAIPSARPGV